MITIVIADDHSFVRQNLRRLVEADPELHLVGEASDGIQALQLTQDLKPQVLITDLIMPGLDGLSLARRIQELQLPTRVILITVQAHPLGRTEALEHGVLGFLHKDMASQHLAASVHSVMKQQPYFQSWSHDKTSPAPPPDGFQETLEAWEMLTRQEKCQLRELAENPSPETPNWSPRPHIRALLNKLGLRTPSELIAFLDHHLPR